MLEPLPNNSVRDGQQWAWDATSITMAQTCPTYYKYKLIYGYRPKNTSIHLIFGQHYATALEHFYKYRAAGASIEDATRRVVRETLADTWGLTFDHAAKTRFSLIRSIVWYLAEFGDESESAVKTHHLADGKPAVELSFSFEMEEDIFLCGHLDRVVNYSDSLFVMDQKTTGGTIGTYFFDQFNPDNQMSQYSLAGKMIFHTPIKGVIIDGAQIAVNFTRFERGFTHRTQEQLDEWWRSALNTIRLTQHYMQIGEFPMNATACGNYGGCDFRNVCASSPRLREMKLKSDFIQQVWDPIERR